MNIDSDEQSCFVEPGSNTVRNLFSFILSTTRMAKRKGINGLDLWSIMKKWFDNTSPVLSAEWKQEVLPEGELYITWSATLEQFPEFDSTGKMIVENHFFHQLINIPRDKEPTLIRLLQIALNIGKQNKEILMTNTMTDITDVARPSGSISAQFTEITIETFMDPVHFAQFNVSEDTASQFVGEFFSFINR